MKLKQTGGQIFSTVNDNEYETMSGTSMAAPHASGAVALVVQYLKQQNSNLAGRNLVERAKILLTNTAVPIIDPVTGSSKLPYLPRKQGAGLIQIHKALKTKAYVVGEDGKAVVALKSFNEAQKEFKLTINNFGDKDLTFNIYDKYGVLINETSTEGAIIYPNAITFGGASLGFNTQTVTVEAGKSSDVIVTLNIPEGANKNNFVEGFITIEDTSTENPNPTLVVPYIGFYGKWDEPRIFDAPYWQSDDTYYGETCLVDEDGYYLGYVTSDKDEYTVIEPEYISFSPNGDTNSDNVMPVLSFLRNAKEFKVQVLDKDKKILREIATDINVRKNIALNSRYKSYGHWLWDGSIYDGKGGYKLADEGQYYIRVTGKIDYPNAEWYTMDMPVKLDLTKPTVDVKVKKIEGNDFEFDFSGCSDNVGVYGYLIFRNEYDNNPFFVEAAKSKKAIVKLDGVKSDVLVYVYDFAGNGEGRFIPIDNDVIRITEAPEWLTTNNKPIVKFEVNEMISNIVDHFEVEVVNNSTNSAIIAKKSIEKATEYSVTSETGFDNGLPDGNYTINIFAYDGIGKTIGQNSVSTVIDTKSPEITVYGENDGVINIDDGREYDLNAMVYDNLTGYKVYLNGNLVDENYGNYLHPVQFYVHQAIKINEGDNIVTLKAVDELGHETVKTVNIKKTTDKPQIIVNDNWCHPISGKIVNVTGRILFSKPVEVYVNSQKAIVDEKGNFAVEITLPKYGANNVEILATNNTITTQSSITVAALPVVLERYIKTNQSEVTIPIQILEKGILESIEVYNGNNMLKSFTPDELQADNINLELKDLVKGTTNFFETKFSLNDGEKVYDYIEIFVDKEFPVMSVVDNFGNLLSDVTIYYINKITLIGSLHEPVKYLKVNGQEVQIKDDTFETEVVFNEGLNRINIEMEDLVGNKNSFVYRVYCDTQAPVVEFINPVKSKVATENDNYEIKFKAFDNVFGYRVFVNGQQMETVEDDIGDGIGKEHSFTVAIPDGESTVEVVVSDQAGNYTMKKIQFYKNVQKPAVLEDGYFNKQNPQDLTAAIVMPKLDGFEVKEIKLGDYVLVKDNDYTFAENILTFKKEFLLTLPRGVNTFELTFSDDTKLNFNVQVEDERSSNLDLKYIKVNGESIMLQNGVYEYDYEANPFMNYVVTAEAIDSKATLEITQADAIPGEAAIRVRAEDGTEALYKVKFIVPIKIEVDENAEFKAGSDAKIFVNAVNVTKNDRPATLIVGLFDKDGKLVQLVLGKYTVKANETIEMGAALSTKNEYAVYTIKVLVWDDIDTMSPLAKTFEYKIK